MRKHNTQALYQLALCTLDCRCYGNFHTKTIKINDTICAVFFTGKVSHKIPHGFFPRIYEPKDTVGSASIFPLFKLFYSILIFCFLRLSFLLLLQQIFLFLLTGASSTAEKLPGRLLSSKPDM